MAALLDCRGGESFWVEGDEAEKGVSRCIDSTLRDEDGSVFTPLGEDLEGNGGLGGCDGEDEVPKMSL